jgi:TonB family protein
VAEPLEDKEKRVASPVNGGRDAVGDLQKEWEGREVDGLRFGPCLGSSGLSAVFRTDRGVIKLLRVDPVERQFSVLERVMALSHPHLARVLAAGRCGTGLLYVLTEYAEEDLAQVLPVRALSVTETREMLDPILTALSYLHGHGFVHGRLKPSNVWVVDGKLKLSSDILVPAGTRLDTGKLRTVYDAPEIADGPATPAADVWSLGVTLVEALTQQRPVFDGSDVELPETIPPGWRAVALACLEPDPRRRITVTELWGRLHPEEVPPKRAERQFGKHALMVAVAAAGIAGAALIGRWSERKAAPAVAEPAPRAAEQVQTRPAAPKPLGKPPEELVRPSALAPARPSSRERARAAALESVQQAVPEPVRPPVREQAPARPAAAAAVPHDQVLERVMPADPAHASSTIQGKVLVGVLVQVDASGRVTGARLDSPGPSRYFAARALEAAQRWRFAPAGENAGARVWSLRFEFRNGGAEISANPAGSVR